MKTMNDKSILNRALFVDRPLASADITALVTLIHRFTEAGDYELFVRRDGQLIARSPVQVVGELRGGPRSQAGGDASRTKETNMGAPNQVNLDLATFGQAVDDCYTDPAPVLATGGLMGFFVSQGTSRYAVSLTRILGDKKETVLDSATGVPAGDFFAVTLLRPGEYTITNQAADAQAKIKVDLPKRGDYRPGGATLVQAVRGGFDPREMPLVSGQSLVFQCQVPSRFVIELIEAAPGTEDRNATGTGERARHTVRKRRPPQVP